MCGILGAVNFLNKELFQNSLNLLNHRGPDGYGIWSNNSENRILLGHKRLSILDLSETGHQPMVKHNMVITFNGEIFNFLELRDELIKEGATFQSESDTEVILEAIHKWGLSSLDRFNGMWAFAIYNIIEGSLILSRDRFGIKPLYYYYKNETLLFASEVKSFYPLLGTSAQLNSIVSDSILGGTFKHHGSELTYLQNVKQLPSGTNLIYNKNSIQLNRWYNLKKVPTAETLEENAKQLKDLLISACNLRLRSDVPVATCLSGGVDSSAISAVLKAAHEKLNHRFQNGAGYQAFCASFPNSNIDESTRAKLMADAVQIPLNIIEINSPDGETLENMMQRFDGPSSTLAFYPIMKLYKQIKAHGFTVSIDGQGPDEMLGGYNISKDALAAALEEKDASWFIDIYNTYSAQGERNDYSSIKIAKRAMHDVLWRDKVKKLFRPIPHFNNTIKFYSESPLDKTSFEKKLFDQFFQNPLPGILNQYDLCSMANSVECRMPFMDYRIVEFVFSLNSKFKIGQGYTKLVLREAMKDLVPEEIRTDKIKLGFNAPVVEWFQGGMKEWLVDQISSKSFRESNYFDGKMAQEEFSNFLTMQNPQWADAWKFWPKVHLTWWENHQKSFK
jgi:asparagine synthase (glutamine-hydrolysing)